MPTVQDFYKAIDDLAPFEKQLSFDNAGFLVGDANRPVHRVIVALDITPEVVREAEKVGAELIISHHPVIFSPLKRLSAQSVPYQLAAKGLAAICAHTNLDFATGGVNTCLANTLGLKNAEPIWVDGIAEGLCGEMDACTPRQFASHVKEKLQSPSVTYTEGEKTVHRVAVCGGAGADILFAAADAGADVLVTGESKHHLLLAAKEIGVTLITAGHYETERVVLQPLCDYLKNRFPDTQIEVSKAEHSPVCVPAE